MQAGDSIVTQIHILDGGKLIPPFSHGKYVKKIGNSGFGPTDLHDIKVDGQVYPLLDGEFAAEEQ